MNYKSDKNYAFLKELWNEQVQIWTQKMKNVHEKIHKDQQSFKKRPKINISKENLNNIFSLLKKANQENNTEEFRQDFPPITNPFEEKGIITDFPITNIQHISDEKVIFQANDTFYLLDGENIVKFSDEIISIGKSPKNNIFAFVYKDKIILKKGFDGEILKEFSYTDPENYEDPYSWINSETQVIPFNNGEKVVILNGYNFCIISDNGEELITDNKWEMSLIAMSNDNKNILLYQSYAGITIYNENLQKVGKIKIKNPFPTFFLFSKNNELLLFDSNNTSNEILLGTSGKKLHGLHVDTKSEKEKFIYYNFENEPNIIISAEKYFISGDKYGYIKAFDFEGKKLWNYYLDSSISGIAISNDEKTLWVGSHSGILHKIKIEEGQDSHTIGSGNHKEERRFIFGEEEHISKW